MLYLDYNNKNVDEHPETSSILNLMTSSKPVETLQQTTALTFSSNEKQELLTRNIQSRISATFFYEKTALFIFCFGLMTITNLFVITKGMSQV